MVFNTARAYSGLDVPLGTGPGDALPMRYPLSIKQHRKRKKLTQRNVADLLGVEQPTYQRWEAGEREPDLKQLGNLADAFGVGIGDLFVAPHQSSVGPKLSVKGEAKAGAWKESLEWQPDSWRTFNGRSDVPANIDDRFGLQVVGDAMDLVYPEGTIIECVTVHAGDDVPVGKRAVLVRRRSDQLQELTVRKLVRVADKVWATAESSNPIHGSIDLDDPEPGIVQQRIFAVVVGSYRPE